MRPAEPGDPVMGRPHIGEVWPVDKWLNNGLVHAAGIMGREEVRLVLCNVEYKVVAQVGVYINIILRS